MPTELRFDVDAYVRLGESRVLGETVRLELLKGRLIEMPSEGDLHMYVRHRLTMLLATALPALTAAGLSFISDPTVRLSEEDAVIPDLVIAPPPQRTGGYRAADIRLVIEVAVSSADYDRSVKREIYAAAGVPVYWLVEPEAKVVRVFSQPKDGAYAQEAVFAPGQSLALHATPGVAFDPADFM